MISPHCVNGWRNAVGRKYTSRLFKHSSVGRKVETTHYKGVNGAVHGLIPVYTQFAIAIKRFVAVFCFQHKHSV